MRLFGRKDESPQTPPPAEETVKPVGKIHHIGEGSQEWFQDIIDKQLSIEQDESERLIKFVRMASHILAAVVELRRDGTKTQHDDLYKVGLIYGYDEEVKDPNPASDAGFLAIQHSDGVLNGIFVHEQSTMYKRGDSESRTMTARLIREALPGLIVTTDDELGET